jgi:hypothetical protein
MTTFTIDTQNAAPFAVVEADTPRAALAAMFRDIGQGEEPTAGEYVETWSQGEWVYRVGTEQNDGCIGGFDYYALPEA